MNEIERSDKLTLVHSDIRGATFREALEMEKNGEKVLKLNTGNPGKFGFEMPESIRQAVIESVERASLLVDERLKTPLRFRFEDTLLHVYCSTQYGKVNDQVRIKKEGDDLEISFNNRYLLDALRACKDETILASLTGPLTSMMLTPVGHRDSSYIYLVLPCRVKS